MTKSVKSFMSAFGAAALMGSLALAQNAAPATTAAAPAAVTAPAAPAASPAAPAPAKETAPAAAAPAAAPAAQEVTVTGTVRTQSNDKNEVSAIKIIEERQGKLYRVELDDNGKKLAELKNRKVTVTAGMVVKKDGRRWLTVKEFKPATEEKAVQEKKAEGKK